MAVDARRGGTTFRQNLVQSIIVLSDCATGGPSHPSLEDPDSQRAGTKYRTRCVCLPVCNFLAPVDGSSRHQRRCHQWREMATEFDDPFQSSVLFVS